MNEFGFLSIGDAGRPARRGAAWLIIVLAALAVLVTGYLAPDPMVGDEVTHYHMLTTQAQALPTPVFAGDIPTGWGTVECRHYPHPNLWHYAGAIVYRLVGGWAPVIQLYHLGYWIQFLVVVMLLGDLYGGRESGATALLLAVLASVPMLLLFSTTFYLDVPLAAQVLTAFYLLRRSRWILAAVFMGLALMMKVTAVLFLPPFGALALLWIVRSRELKPRQKRVTLGMMLVVLLIAVTVVTWTLSVFAHTRYYPLHRAVKVIERVVGVDAVRSPKVAATEAQEDSARGFLDKVISNHPGDLRRPINYIVFGGVVMWGMALLGALGLLVPGPRPGSDAGVRDGPTWAAGVGVWFAACVAFQTKTAPDARFFLPALPFLLLPLARGVVRLPFARFLVPLALMASLAQGGAVLYRVHGLRSVPGGLREVIKHLEATHPEDSRIFMYPEGNYRLFPCKHDWYLGYRLRDFWRADNDERLRMLRERRISAIVVKKHLIADPGPDLHNLGVYPPSFVADLKRDERFTLVLENDAALVFTVAPEPSP